MAKNYKDAKTLQTKYWKNKPVMKLNEKVYVSKQIATDEQLSRYKKSEPMMLPENYRWEIVKLNDDNKMTEVASFLSTHYRRGSDSTYIVPYDTERLRWEMNNIGFFLTVLSSEGADNGVKEDVKEDIKENVKDNVKEDIKENNYVKEDVKENVGENIINNLKNHENIIGLIGVTYRTVVIYADKQTMAEPMYLCCKKKYRDTGLAKVLMDELMRCVMLLGVETGVYCNNRIVPKPVATIRQYSRPLNYKKLFIIFSPTFSFTSSLT